MLKKYCLTIKKLGIFCANLTKVILDTVSMADYNETVFYYNHLMESYHYLEKESD